MWMVALVWHYRQFRKTAAWVTPDFSAVGILPSCLILIASSGRKRKKGKKKREILLTGRLVQTYHQNNAASLRVQQCFWWLSLWLFLRHLSPFFLTDKLSPQKRMSCLIHFNLLFGIKPCKNSFTWGRAAVGDWGLCCVLLFCCKVDSLQEKW